MSQERTTDVQALDLAAFLAHHSPVASDEAVWLGGTIRLRIDCYVSREAPPPAHVGAPRSVVLRGAEVLTLRNADEWHVLPGGRCEPGEPPVRALRRELLEEAGLHLKRPRQLGFMHLHHLTPKPPNYAFMYPDFLSLVYVSAAGKADARAKLADDYEEEAVFTPVAEARRLDLSVESRTFLKAAMDLGRQR